MSKTELLLLFFTIVGFLSLVAVIVQLNSHGFCAERRCIVSLNGSSCTIQLVGSGNICSCDIDNFVSRSIDTACYIAQGVEDMCPKLSSEFCNKWTIENIYIIIYLTLMLITNGVAIILTPY